MSQSAMRVTPPGLLQLPIELVIHTLNQLRPEELRAMAAVSRALYKAAVLAGHCIPFTIEVQPGASAAPQLGKFRDATCHAQVTGVGLKLVVVCGFAIPGPVDRCYYAAYEDMMLADILAIILAVAAALPYLVNLYVQPPEIVDADLVAALRHAAPRLRSLNIRFLHSVDYQTESLPSDFLGACAPNLRKVALCNVMVSPVISPDSGPILAFRNVTHLRVDFNDDRVPALAPHFPRLSDLYLAYNSAEGEQPAAGFESVLDGLELLDLTVEEGSERYDVLSGIARASDLRKIRCVSHICANETWAMPPWHNERGKICVRVHVSYPRDDTIDILVVPADRSWLYTSHPENWPSLTDAFPLSGMPHLGVRLEYLRLSSLFVLGFVTASGGVTYDALKRLHVDLEFMDWIDTLDDGEEPFGRIWPFSRRVLETRGVLEDDLDIARFPLCPRLEELTISVYGGELARIEAAELRLVVRTLRQADPSKAVRPSLVLLSVELDDPEVLDGCFSSVRRAFIDGSITDDDHGLWDG